MTVLRSAPKPDEVGRVRRPIDIKSLLEWAFADECASIDFEDEGTLAGNQLSTGNAYRMAMRGALGCRIDGGGRSLPDHDADIVASACAVLPESVGGRGMAIQIASHARTRSVPEAYVGVQSRVEPFAWHVNPHGKRARTERLGVMVDRSGRKPRQFEIRHCPIIYTPEPAIIAAARRNYVQWWLALLEIKSSFAIHSNLSRWEVSDDMPTLKPWEQASTKYG